MRLLIPPHHTGHSRLDSHQTELAAAAALNGKAAATQTVASVFLTVFERSTEKRRQAGLFISLVIVHDVANQMCGWFVGLLQMFVPAHIEHTVCLLSY